MRHHTGGFLTVISCNALDLINRKHLYSVSTVVTGGDAQTLAAVQKLQSQIAVNTAKGASLAGKVVRSLAKRVAR